MRLALLLIFLVGLIPTIFVAVHLPRPTSMRERFETLAMTMRLDAGELAPTLPTASELRTRCQEAAARIIDLRSIPEERRPDTWAADLNGAATELRDYDLLEQSVSRNERAAMDQIAWDTAVAAAEAEAANPANRDGNGPNAATGQGGDGEFRSAGQMFTENELYTSRSSVKVDPVEVRNLLTGGSVGGTGSDLFAPVGSPALNQSAVRRMRFFLRDVIPVTPTGLQTIPYIRELNAATHEAGATTVAEASAKPEVTMLFEQADAPVRKIAAWIQITEEAYNDAPTLRGYIDTRLAYMLGIEEEAQYLNGDGNAPNIEGILQVSGIQTQAAINDDLAGTIGLAVGKIENVDGMADAIAINPITFWTGVVERHSTWMDGAQFGSAGGGLPFAMPPMTLFGLPTIRTRAMAANKALVGCYGIGAQIFERMGTTIKSTDSHASLFISNTLVVLAEKREALAVHRPDFFVDTTLAFT